MRTRGEIEQLIRQLRKQYTDAAYSDDQWRCSSIAAKLGVLYWVLNEEPPKDYITLV